VNWSTLTIGPENGVEIVVEDDTPKRKTSFKKSAEEDSKPIMDAIYDDGPPF
jgi:hypothetical protein